MIEARLEGPVGWELGDTGLRIASYEAHHRTRLGVGPSLESTCLLHVQGVQGSGSALLESAPDATSNTEGQVVGIAARQWGRRRGLRRDAFNLDAT